jgi:hypothetical protein
MVASTQFTCYNCNGILLPRNSSKHIKCVCGELYRIEASFRQENSSFYHRIPLRSRIADEAKISLPSGDAAILGCAVINLSYNALNIWTLELENKVFFLQEGYGFYALLEPQVWNQYELARKLIKLDSGAKIELPRMGTFLLLQMEDFWGFDIYKESAFDVRKLEKRLLLQGSGGEPYIEIWIASDGIYTLQQKEIDLTQQLNKNTNILNGEAQKASCSNCKKVFALTHFPQIRNYVCSSCNLHYNYWSKREWQSTYLSKKEMRSDLLELPLGKQLIIHDNEFELVGQSIKKDQEGGVWQEFTLHCVEDGGYAFLSGFTGNYMLVQEIMEAPLLSDINANFVYFEGETYRGYHSYQPELLWAEGQIFDNPRASSMATSCYDYISPPFLLTLERYNKKYAAWFRGEHIERSELIAQGISLPPKRGLGMIEPATRYSINSVVIASAFIIILLCLAQLFIGKFGEPSKVVLAQEFIYRDTTKQLEVVTDTFSLSNFRSNISVNVKASFENNWISLDYTLTNINSGQEYTASKDLEFYQGSVEGAIWEEGSRSNEHLFTAVPRGIYLLNVSASKGSDFGAVRSIKVSVVSGTQKGLNFWFPLFSILIVSVTMIAINYFREQARWEP